MNTSENGQSAQSCEGFLLVNKPAGMSSFGVIRRLRHITGVKKIGHAGTLDPFATGLLIVAIGKSFTKRIEEMQGLPKEYVTTMVIGAETDTLDRDGKIKRIKLIKNAAVTDKTILDVTGSFVGSFMQEPPQFSAKRIGGKRAYKLARKGQEVSLRKSLVEVTEISLISIQNGIFPECTLKINCSKGTYIRSLVRDISYGLNSCGFTKTLTRTKIGQYDVLDALNLDQMDYETVCQNLKNL